MTPSELRGAGLRTATGELVLLLEDGDELDPDCLETLVRARTSGADVVTCGVRCKLGRIEQIHLFLGEPGGLGLVANYYGSLALYPRTLLEQMEQPPDVHGDGDADWVLLATLSLAGARILAVPRPLAGCKRTPGSAATDPIGSGAALAVVRAFERSFPPELQEMPRLVASLAARRVATSAPLVERIRWVWHYEGAPGLTHRIATRMSRLAGTKRRSLPRFDPFRRRRSSARAASSAHGSDPGTTAQAASESSSGLDRGTTTKAPPHVRQRV
jgi:hypothetical protein